MRNRLFGYAVLDIMNTNINQTVKVQCTEFIIRALKTWKFWVEKFMMIGIGL